jgi:hypothetical protein
MRRTELYKILTADLCGMSFAISKYVEPERCQQTGDCKLRKGENIEQIIRDHRSKSIKFANTTVDIPTSIAP